MARVSTSTRIWRFELYRDSGGTWPLNADGEPRDEAGQAFWEAIRRFYALPEAERETYRRGGGCVVLGSART